MIYLLNKNNMKKLAYIATIACSMFLTTSCVDLTQEPQSFITDEDLHCQHGPNRSSTSCNRTL